MHPFYSLMGLIAAASHKMSRNTVNGLPLNWWLLGACALFAIIANDARRDAVSNGQTPQAMSVTEFLQLGRTDFQHRYVAVTGTLLPPMKLDVSKGSEHFDLVPLVDLKTKSGFFVHAGDEVHGGNQAQKVTLTGMMWSVPSDLRDDLSAAVPKYAPLVMDSSLELSEGQTPGNPLTTTVVMSGLAAISVLFLLSSLQKHIFFRRTKSRATQGNGAASPFSDSSALGETAQAPQNGPALRFSGKLRLNEKVASRFWEMPSVLIELEGGQLAFASHIDASPRFNGQVTQSQVGVWLSAPQSGTLHIEEGLFYAGARGKPALRLRYCDEADKSKKTTAILSFNSLSERAEVQKELSQGGVRA